MMEVEQQQNKPTTVPNNTASTSITTLDIQGRVYWPDTPGFEGAYKDRLFPSVISQRAPPAVVVVPVCVADIVQALQYATAQQQQQVCIRSGGHNWLACSWQPHTMLLDLQRFNAVTDLDVHHRTATVGPSVDGRELNRLLLPHNLCFPTGHCCGVPVGGFLLGGGQGWFQDYFGYAARRVVAFDVVTATGHVRTVRRCDNNDWMWLLQGAGSAFPGVVTSFTLDLHPLPPILRNVTRCYALHDVEALVRYLLAQRQNGCLSTKTETNLILTCNQDGATCCKLAASFMADTQDEFSAQLDVLRRIPCTPLLDKDELDVLELPSFADLTELQKSSYPPNMQWHVQSFLLQANTVALDWLSPLAELVAQQSTLLGTNNSNENYSHMLLVVGASDDSITTSTPPGVAGLWPGMHLDSVICCSGDQHPDETDRLHEWEQRVERIVTPHMVGFNVLEHPCNADTFDRIFVGDRAEKLRQLRRQLDPNNLFWDPSATAPWA